LKYGWISCKIYNTFQSLLQISSGGDDWLTHVKLTRVEQSWLSPFSGWATNRINIFNIIRMLRRIHVKRVFLPCYLVTLSSRSIIGSASMIHLKWVSAYPSFRSIKVGNKFQRIVSPMSIYWTFKTIYTTGFNYFIWWWVPMVHDYFIW
jgi:hypothetical protein